MPFRGVHACIGWPVVYAPTWSHSRSRYDPGSRWSKQQGWIIFLANVITQIASNKAPTKSSVVYENSHKLILPPNTSTLERHGLFVGESVFFLTLFPNLWCHLSGHWKTYGDYNRIHPTYWVTRIEKALRKPFQGCSRRSQLPVASSLDISCTGSKGITVDAQTTQMSAESQFCFFELSLAFFEVEFFFSWWMKPTSATWAIKQLPSKQTQKSRRTSIFHPKNTL